MTEVMKVEPWGQGQGAYVEINKSDFDPAKHTEYGKAKPAPRVQAPAPAAPASFKKAVKRGQ